MSVTWRIVALLALVFAIGGARRFVRVEASLDAGGYAPLARGEALLIGAVATVLGIATLALVFVH